MRNSSGIFAILISLFLSKSLIERCILSEVGILFFSAYFQELVFVYNSCTILFKEIVFLYFMIFIISFPILSNKLVAKDPLYSSNDSK